MFTCRISSWCSRPYKPVSSTHLAPTRTRHVVRAVDRTAFSFETRRVLKAVLTRQALKTLITYLSETNGELHYWLTNHVAANPLPLDGRADPDDWIVTLASTPLTRVQDPARSSVVTLATAAAVMNGEREVSPRDVAERLMSLREHIAKEMQEDLSQVPADNQIILRRTLEKTISKSTL